MKSTFRTFGWWFMYLGAFWLPFAAPGCASLHSPPDAGVQPVGASVTGMVTARVRTVLPQDALLRVELADTSRPNAPPRTINLKEVWTEGRQFPLPFDIPYSAAAIDSEGSYALLVRIVRGNRPLFTNGTGHKVITNGVRSNVEVVVDPVPGPDGLTR